MLPFQKRRLLIICLLACLYLTGCAHKIIEEEMAKTRTSTKESGKHGYTRKADRIRRRELTGPDPSIRIGLMEEYDRIQFSFEGSYDLLNLAGDVIAEGLVSDQKWRVVPDRTVEARAVYSILTTAFARRDAADQLRRSLSAKDHPARVVEVGEEIAIDGKVVANNIKFRVLVGRWTTERDARDYLEIFREDFAPRIVRQVIRPSTGSIELFNEDYTSSHLIEDGIRLVPKDENSRVTLFAVREGTGFHWERETDRTYTGIIEFRLDPRALLMALTEIPLEQYLQGVVPAEMPAAYPLEALKAQAIAARSEVLAKIGVKHLNDPFDLCATVHCQVYSGCTNLHEHTSEAVEATRGQVLIVKKHVAEAVYSSCCGGHTENKVNVWNPPEAEHLQGIWDASDKSAETPDLDLTTEKGAQSWVSSEPDAWCNAKAFEDLPTILDRSTRYFRWEFAYPRRELEEIIRRKSGEDIGELIDIIPLERGVSGRLMELEIQGTRRNLRIQRELNIRRILSTSYLYSACFNIHVEHGSDGRPINFILKGAGFGHGVGMCQVGAGVMAAKDKDFKDILMHYYPGIGVEKVY